MVLDLLDQLIPYGIVILILFFLWLAVKNKRRLHKIKYTGRVSEIIDRRRNFIFYLVLCIVLFVYLLSYLYLNRSAH